MAKDTPLTTVVTAIATGQVDSDLDAVIDALNERRKVVKRMTAAINKATIKVGTRVMLKGLSPKSLNGHTGKVIPSGPYTSRSRFDVELDSPHYGRSRRANGETTIRGIPAQCVEAIN